MLSSFIFNNIILISANIFVFLQPQTTRKEANFYN